MTWPLHEVMEAYVKYGADAALPLLDKIMPKVSDDDLRQALLRWEICRDWVLVIRVWLELIRRFTADGQAENAAYFWNELGVFLRDVGDDRALGCFRKALTLTRSPGRRMRTLGRIGDFLAISRRDWDKALRAYRGGITVGERHGCNPLHIEQLRMRIAEVERDRRDLSDEFRQLREQVDRDRAARADVLRVLRLPL